jgi:nickel transport protein
MHHFGSASVLCCVLMSLVFLTSGHSQAHALLYEAKNNSSAVVLHFFYEGGREKPFFEQYEVFAPNSELSFQEGRINELGEISFRPNSEGLWRVKVVTSDGHARTVILEVDQVSQIVTTQSNAQHSDILYRLLTVIGYIFGIFGLVMLWRNKGVWLRGNR